jgi:hypothetical protein
VGGRAATSHVGPSREPPFRGRITTLDARDGEGKWKSALLLILP